MPELGSPDAPLASWQPLEQSIERLHRAARSALPPREFYRLLVGELTETLGALGGAVWLADAAHGVQLLWQSEPAGRPGEPEPAVLRRGFVAEALAAAIPSIHPRSAPAAPRPYLLLVQPVPLLAAEGRGSTARGATAVLEAWFAAGATPPVQQAWLEFAAALAAVAADFQALDELRRLREVAALHAAAASLGRRLQSARDVETAAFEIASEGRRILACDRLSVVLRHGERWRVASVSGAAGVERYSEFARRLEQLAQRVAGWGEPIGYCPGQGDAAPADTSDLPPEVIQAIDQHLDQTHAQAIACVPLRYPPGAAELAGDDLPRLRRGFDAVLVAEQFSTTGAADMPQSLVELAEQAAPALARAAGLDHFPIRVLMRLFERLDRLRVAGGWTRPLAIAASLLGVVAALTFIPADFDVEASGALRAAAERDVFATSTGAVAEIHVEDGQSVRQGDVLIVLSDPELLLKLQQTRGELDAARKRLEALAVSRSDRTLREPAGDDRLPLAAEFQQLQERLASLQAELDLLESRREALTLRSPLTGQVLAPDAQSLLASRPVERGQVLLTVADARDGWQLEADVPQRQIGHVLAAQQGLAADGELTASLRLAGDVAQTYAGRVVGIDAAAPLDAEGLHDDAPPIKVRIAVEGQPAAARPGMGAAVRIHCGRRSLGYVWLHGAAATVYRWLTF